VCAVRRAPWQKWLFGSAFTCTVAVVVPVVDAAVLLLLSLLFRPARVGVVHCVIHVLVHRILAADRSVARRVRETGSKKPATKANPAVVERQKEDNM
jgi:hypothetical protein